MSFRTELIDKLKIRYANDVLKRKSVDADWSKIRGYFRAFIEDVSDISEFALAKFDANDTELSLLVEGHELSFRRYQGEIHVVVNAEHVADFVPTIEGYCLNFKEQRILEVMDEYMRLAFNEVLSNL